MRVSLVLLFFFGLFTDFIFGVLHTLIINIVLKKNLFVGKLMVESNQGIHKCTGCLLGTTLTIINNNN